MRVLLLLLFILLSLTSLTAQPIPEWYRVYTFDESKIEMNTSFVTMISSDVSRVRFRWSFEQPQLLSKSRVSIYESRLEVLELNCSLKRYRPYHLTFYDAAGNIVRIQDVPSAWLPITSGSMMEKLFVPACQLVEKKTKPRVVDSRKVELDSAARYAYLFSQQLERTKDFGSVIDKFFVSDYLNGYLQDKNTKWFLNLDKDIAAKVGRKELQRFYVALMNAAYLSSVFILSQYHDSEDELPAAQIEKLIPADVLNTIKNHRYTATYQDNQNNYDFLAEKLDSVERLNSYTDLLERIAALMRKHVIQAATEHSDQYRAIFEGGFFEPIERVCVRNCLGLPLGTKLVEVDIPLFHLQLANISGDLRVVSAKTSFQ